MPTSGGGFNSPRNLNLFISNDSGDDAKPQISIGNCKKSGVSTNVLAFSSDRFVSGDSWMDRVKDVEGDAVIASQMDDILNEFDDMARELTKPSFDVVKKPTSLYDVRNICELPDAVEVIKMLKKRDGEWCPTPPTAKEARDEKLRGARALHCFKRKPEAHTRRRMKDFGTDHDHVV